MGPKLMKLLQTETDGHQRIWQHVEKIPNSGRRKSPSQGGKKLEDRKDKRKESRERSIRGS